MRHRVADVVLDAAFEHHERLVGVVVRVQARALPGRHDRDEHRGARGAVDRRVAAEGIAGLVQDHRHDLAREDDVHGFLRDAGELLLAGGHLPQAVETADAALELLGGGRVDLRHAASSE
jgi:hypothetical protein